MQPDLSRRERTLARVDAPRIIRKKEVMRRVALSSMHIWRLEKRGTFPLRVQLGPNSVGWLEAEVDAWIQQRVRERDERPGTRVAPTEAAWGESP
jgi:prophage regulatory protein